MGCLKLNVDAAVFEERDVIGIGGTIRDHDGVVLVCWALQLTGNFDVLTSELLAIREGIRLAIEFGYPLDEIDSDSLLAINAINRPHPCSTVVSVVKDINFFITSAGYGSCHHISRVGNMVAHELAFFAIRAQVDKV